MSLCWIHASTRQHELQLQHQKPACQSCQAIMTFLLMYFCRFITPIGVRELMYFFDATHTSVNAVGEAELASAVGVSHQAKRQRTGRSSCEGAVLTQQTPLLPAEAAAQPPASVPTQQVRMREPKSHALDMVLPQIGG